MNGFEPEEPAGRKASAEAGRAVQVEEPRVWTQAGGRQEREPHQRHL